MDNAIRKIVILGGGTAGWMAASYLGKALNHTVDITVLAAPDIPTLGVGEATIPNLQTAFFDFLGIAEDEWMRECNASYKMAVKFINWRTGGDGVPQARDLNGRPDHFYHVFGLLPYHDQLPLSHYWFYKRWTQQSDEPFDYACYKEPPILDAKLAPRWMDGTRATNYAWHFDAHLVADYLRRFATEKLGVRHIPDQMVHVTQSENGFIESLTTKSGLVLTADLFIDCSGFRGALINRALGEPFLDMRDHLLCDSAVASVVPHDDEANGVEPYTSAIAMKAGWTWKIPMLGRFGSGYVYSSRFADEEEAVRDFCALWNLDPETTSLNKIRFRVGRNRRAWVKNCVSIGTSSCFVEPLESTGIYFIYAALYQLVKHFPDRNFNPVLIDRFNREIELMFDDTRDFIQAHFYFSPRMDTPFWRANKRLQLGDNMRDKMEMYRAGLGINCPPTDDAQVYYGNFEEEFRNFWNNSNYYCVLAGLGHVPEAPTPRLNHMASSLASVDAVFDKVKKEQRELLQTLPTCYEFLRKQHGR
ncbi:tryptophan halogenase [Carbonactinospora thermoautotrophica]|uniref:Tryptophan halogenase n=1 Tax=Carbonactinospora thermoautotrophica TaxID=1469144 RepID=A0A132N2I3_9ACTN|nr:tryptophan halogenase family protein [Carbonactinospora thermoautotrophica]KWX00845.1 Tryptophan halogenase [Carbonactinospora thermoautotrophica]KWX04303.1 tryptophan halogenase [Carbonactinospora thermoautotrophica]KWX05233.1 tryptophan halogenase [Carbonactinospora thermoautotrophica]